MKIIKNILLFILPLLAMFSCTECWETNIINDGKLSTTISVEIPQLFDTQSQTRAMGENPDLKNLYLAVFDKNGYLMDYVQAELEQTQGLVSGKYNYKVSLTPTSEKTIVHFIGNAPTNISFGSEVQIISSLYTTGGEEAYWQRIEFANGINETSAVPNVVLIRNFAWIDLIDGADNFKIDSYCVMNTYDKGSIAPYNTKEGKGWITNYKDQTYEKLTGTPEFYNGFIPAEAELSNDIPDKSDEPLPKIHFVYEREKSLSGNHPYILIKGFYNNSTNKFNNILCGLVQKWNS